MNGLDQLILLLPIFLFSVVAHEYAHARVASIVRKAEEKGVALSCTVEPSVPRRVVGDEGHVSQILNNLLSNAIKYSGDEPPEIEVADPGTELQEGTSR